MRVTALYRAYSIYGEGDIVGYYPAVSLLNVSSLEEAYITLQGEMAEHLFVSPEHYHPQRLWSGYQDMDGEQVFVSTSLSMGDLLLTEGGIGDGLWEVAGVGFKRTDDSSSVWDLYHNIRALLYGLSNRLLERTINA